MITVLYVDEDPVYRDTGKQYLEKTDEFTVDTAVSAREAMALPRFPQYDAIVSGYRLPGMDGIAFLKHVRSTASLYPTSGRCRASLPTRS